MNFYKRFMGDIQSKTGHLSLAEFGAYDRLLDHYYATEQGLPGDLDACCRVARAMTKDERKAVESVLAQFFTLADGIYTQGRTEEMIADAQPKIAAAKTNGAKGGRPKKNPTETQEKPTGLPEITQTEPNSIPSQSQSQTEEEAKASLSEPGVPPCPVDSLIDKFTQRLPMLPGIRKSLFKAGKNADAMRSRWRWVMTAEHEKGERKGQRLATTAAEGIDWFDKYFSFVAESDFLTGANGKWTACDLSWLLTASKFEAVLSGKYHQKEEVAA